MFRIGCDVGGTNTDAAILDVTRVDEPSRGVLATCKTATTSNVTDGIKSAIRNILNKSGVDRKNVLNVSIGTTHFVNAVVENDERYLRRVAVVRLCGPYTRKNQPFSDWPYSLRDVVEGPIYYLSGGMEVDGREIEPLNLDEIRQTAQAIVEAGINAVAVVGVFSALDHEGLHEETCRRTMLEVCPNLSVVCSAAIGGPGLLVRENATILNAAILSFAKKTIRGFQGAMLDLNLSCPLFITQNDGTLVEASQAADLPVRTFASGPTNSLMGAAFLQNLSNYPIGDDQQLLVVDIGGTTTDVCALLPNGFPRKAAGSVEIGGVRTAFSMPEVYCAGLGGGSRVRVAADSTVTVGPDSVAHRLTTDAMIFGGKTMTTSDIVVAAGQCNLGDADRVASIAPEVVIAAKREIRRHVERAIDRMKVSAAPAVVLLVGGGSIVVDGELDGVDKLLRPPHHDSANAVGAAIAKIAGEVDVIEVLAGRNEREVLETVKQKAITAAVAKGADEKDVTVIDINKIPLQYVNNQATRFIVKAVGSLNPNIIMQPGAWVEINETEDSQDILHRVASTDSQRSGSMAKPACGVDLNAYRPDVRDGMWYVSPIDVELIASGCGVLGTGGGGSSYDMALHVLDILSRGGQGKIRVVAPTSLQDSDTCVFGSGYGAPSVSDERVDSGNAIFTAVQSLNNILNIPDFDAVVAVEIGGGNGLVTMPTGAHFDRPIVDCDLMGRAYPTAEHCTPYLFGQSITPCAITNCKGNVSIIVNTESNSKLEDLLRTTCVELGNSAAAAEKPLSGAVIKKYAIPNTISQAWFLGRAIHIARQSKIDFIEAIGEVMPVKLLYTGKIIDVTRDVTGGYTMGRCTIAPLSAQEQGRSSNNEIEKRNMIIPFQNEYLAAYMINEGASYDTKEVICTVPDLISILGQDGEAIGSPDLRFGLQVKVIGMPAHPLWTGTPEGMKIGGPEFFKLGMPWKSIGEYRIPRSVFEEFS